MENTNKNIFITGKAGTGKSYLLNAFSQKTKKKILKLAPTGISALNIQGATIHSVFGYDNLESFDPITRKSLNISQDSSLLLKSIDTIIIDEISMVRADKIDRIDKILRLVCKSKLPFGGKQMIFFGDAFQLPPIAQSEEIKYLNKKYGGIFFFDASAYKRGSFKFVELLTNHRQSADTIFFEMLNRIREGKTLDEDLSTLNERVISSSTDLDRTRKIMTLYPTKLGVESKNQSELNQIHSEKEFIYHAEIIKDNRENKKDTIENSLPIASELKLKVGVPVMFVKNNKGKWQNGTMGIVSKLSANAIFVTIEGIEYEITKYDFTIRKAQYVNEQVIYRDIFTVSQYPIVLAYAMTIHKSQGKTFNEVICDISKCFSYGQAYVALSRCRSLEGLHLLSPIESKNALKVDSSVRDFYLSSLSSSQQLKFIQ